MALFISYSRQDAADLSELAAALHRSRQDVWIDQELGGGDAWWNTICERIRACDVLVVALSNHWLRSKPCQAELRYAQALNKPILPVRIGPVDNMRVNSLAELQIVDYETPTAQSGVELITAVHVLTAQPRSLPDPLPEQPAVPYGYLMRLGDAMADKEISPQQQLQMLVELKAGLDEDGDDPSARSDIAQLMRMLRMRHDVTFRTRTEIDNVLASLEPASAPPEPEPPAVPKAAAVPATPTPQRGGAAAMTSKRWIIVGAAVAVVAVAIGAVLLTTSRGSAGSASQESSSAAAGAPAASDLSALLLTPQEMGSIIGDPTLLADQGQEQRPRISIGTLSTPGCEGAFGALEGSAYEGATGLGAVRGEPVHSAGPDPRHRVYQAVARFTSAADASSFVQEQATRWQGCGGTDVTFTSPQSTQSWSFSPLGGAPPKIWMSRRVADGGATGCHHTLEAVSDVVVDVDTCSADDPVGIAGRIANAIIDKVSR